MLKMNLTYPRPRRETLPGGRADWPYSIPASDGQEHLFIPSWGLDLEYWFNEKWGVGSHNDIEVESFIVETDHEEFIEREYPLVTTLELLAKPWKGCGVQI